MVNAFLFDHGWTCGTREHSCQKLCALAIILYSCLGTWHFELRFCRKWSYFLFWCVIVTVLLGFGWRGFVKTCFARFVFHVLWLWIRLHFRRLKFVRVQLGVGCAGRCSDPIGTSFEPRRSSVHCVLYHTCTVCNVHTLTYIYILHIYTRIMYKWIEIWFYTVPGEEAWPSRVTPACIYLRLRTVGKKPCS